MFPRNPRHVVIFSLRAEKTLIMMAGAPKCCLTEARRHPEERPPALQRRYFVKLMPELTWSGVQSLTPESSRCLLFPLLPTFNDIVSRLQGYGGVLSPLMAAWTDENALYYFSRISRSKVKRCALVNSKASLKKIKQLVERLRWMLIPRPFRPDGAQFKAGIHF